MSENFFCVMYFLIFVAWRICVCGHSLFALFFRSSRVSFTSRGSLIDDSVTSSRADAPTHVPTPGVSFTGMQVSKEINHIDLENVVNLNQSPQLWENELEMQVVQLHNHKKIRPAETHQANTWAFWSSPLHTLPSCRLPLHCQAMGCIKDTFVKASFTVIPARQHPFVHMHCL